MHKPTPSPSLYALVFESNPTGNYLLSPTPEAIILAVNDAFLRASSRRREDLVGRSLFAAFPGNPDDPEDTGELVLRESIVRVIETGEPDTLPAQRYPITIRMPDGSTRYEERFWSAMSTPVFGEDGELLCVSHTTADVTDKVRSERALRESERRFRALITATADVVYRMSPDWKQMRQLEGRGFLKDVVEGLHFWIDEYIPAAEQPRVHAAIGQAIRDKSLFEVEHRVRRADGSEGWVLSRAVPMLDEQGEIYEWIGAASDITERKQAEEKLKLADRRKDEFLAMLAHELRNPLAPISAAAGLLQTGRLDPARVQQTSHIIGRQVAHMTSLVDDLLDVSRVTHGQIELEDQPIEVGVIVSDAVEQVGPLIAARQHQLEVRLARADTRVCGDRKRLVQVLANLLNNAAKFTPQHGHIGLSTALENGSIRIEVSDNGIGMAPEMVERAFDLFAQAERPADRSLGGLGLGLALVRSLVELHHGWVHCASAGPGQGSRFTVCLPRLAEPADPAQGAAHAHAEAQDGEGLLIMVVDDNVDAAGMLGMLLEASGHRVLVEHSAARALERGREASPQVFLLDIGLPEVDGYELARRLRAQPATAGAMLIAVTGYGQESDRRLAEDAGFDAHFVKPVDIARLTRLLDDLAAGR
jgi:PAS domain S-box-containing protein